MTPGAPGHGWSKQAAYLAWYDFELPLRDALGDPELAPVRRALAVLGMSTGLDTGHFAAAELLDAVYQLATDRAGGTKHEQDEHAPPLFDILDGTGCDYQRALCYTVSRCGPEAAVSHLEWLTELMRARAGMFRAIRAAGGPMPLLPAVVPDGGWR